jgi:2-polyprenyl-3-methyl-5-hydroxy-6-metoxy-1,4-benzoquinol methylase
MACIICQEAAGEEVLSNLAKCSECGLIYYDNTSNSSTLSDLYQESYFNGEEYLNYKNDKPIIQKNFNSRLNEIKKYAQGGSLFEIGCAYGFFLELAKENFSVGGIDITEEPTRFAREELGLKVTSGNYLEQDLKEKKDVFCMWDTIEHLERPEEFIKKVSSEIRQGGYFFLTTGDIGSLLAKVRGKKWRMIHPPTHLFTFLKRL